MSFWVLNPICCLNTGFTTGIERKIEMIYLTERAQITGQTRKACADCTRVPKNSLKPFFLRDGNPGMTFGTTAELLIIDHTLKMITAKHWGTEITVISWMGLAYSRKRLPIFEGKEGRKNGKMYILSHLF